MRGDVRLMIDHNVTEKKNENKVIISLSYTQLPLITSLKALSSDHDQ